MKRHLFLVAALAASMAVSAAVIVDETFNYDADTLCAEGTGWTSSGILTTGENRAILATPLVYTQNDKEYILSGVGKAVKNVYTSGTNYIAYKQFSTLNSGVVYLSYLYKGDGDQGQSQSEVVGLSNVNNQSAVKAWAGKQSSGTKNPFLNISFCSVIVFVGSTVSEPLRIVGSFISTALTEGSIYIFFISSFRIKMFNNQ